MTDSDLRAALAELSSVRSEGEPVVTLYLDTSFTDEKARERARVHVEDAIHVVLHHRSEHPQREALERTLERVRGEALGRATTSRSSGARGLALFACESAGLWRVIEAARSFRTELTADVRPHLLQLARLLDDVEPAIVAFVHDRGLALYEIALGALVHQTTIEGAVPTRHGQGGRVRGGASPSPHGASGGASFERERKNQRHVEELVQRVRREGVEELVRLWDRDPRQNVVLAGTSEKVADLERMLPERVRAAVVDRLPRPPGKEPWAESGKGELVRRTVELVMQAERESERAQVEHAVGEALRGGMAVLGPEDVVLAVNQRRVRRLILEEDFARAGWACRNCGVLGTTHEAACHYCGGEVARIEALGEELASRVFAERGEVEIVAHTNRLHSYDGVAALLRQAHAKGLAGRREEAPQA